MAASKPKKKQQQQRKKRSQKSQHVTSINARKELLLDTVEDQTKSRRITRQKVSYAKEKISKLSARDVRIIQRNKNNGAATSTVTNALIDARKELLLDTVEDQSRRITRQKVSHAKEKISKLSARDVRMIQRNKNNAATSTVTNDKQKNKYNDEELDSVVPAVVVETPTKESTNLLSSPSQSKSAVTNPPTRQIRHASKAALEAIGKIARFERALNKEKLSNTFELDETDISLSCSSGNDGSAYISRKSSAMQKTVQQIVRIIQQIVRMILKIHLK